MHGDSLADCVDPDEDNDGVPDVLDCVPRINSVSTVPAEVGPTLSALISESLRERFLDTALPPVGAAFLYLITGTNRCGEGSAGTSSDGQPRPIPVPAAHLPSTRIST